MSATPSIVAISVAASTHRLDPFPHSVAGGTAAVSNSAPEANQAGGANAQGLARTNHVDVPGTSPGAAAASPAPGVALDYDPRSPYGPANGVPSADLAREMIQQLVAYYPFTANGQVHAAARRTVDITT